MEYRDETQAEISDEELVRHEVAEHDELYEGTHPFWLDSDDLSLELFDRLYQPCYKDGAYLNGLRKRRMVELVDSDRIEGQNLLVIGSGQGANSVLFALHGATVHATDVSREAVRVTRRVAEANDVADRVHVTQQSATDMAYGPGQFDVVIASSVLHHIWKYDGVQDAIYDALKPGGRFVFDDGLRGNSLYTGVRDFLKDDHDLGDVDLEYDDIEAFSRRFSEGTIETFTLLSGAKRQLADRSDTPSGRRKLLYVLSKIDRGLERLPGVGPYCLDVVGEFKK